MEKLGPSAALRMICALYDAMNPNQGRGGDNFWPSSAKECMGHSAVSCYQANGRVDVRDVMRWMEEMPCSVAELTSDHWRADSFVAGCLRRAEARGFGGNLDHENAEQYATAFWPRLDVKVSGSIKAEVRTFLSPYLGAEVSPLVNGASTITPEDIAEDGRIVVVGTPVLSHGIPGRMINLSWKISTLFYLLARPITPDLRHVVICTDEANWFACADIDALAQSVARESRIIGLMAFQNLPLLRKCLGGDQAATELSGWTGNFGTWIAAQNSERETNEHVSKLIGDTVQIRLSGGPCREFDLLADGLGLPQEGGGGGWSEDIRRDVPPEQFQKLAKGGSGYVETIICRGGKRLPGGKNWVRHTFRQG